jgi:hypothetical protein
MRLDTIRRVVITTRTLRLNRIRPNLTVLEGLYSLITIKFSMYKPNPLIPLSLDSRPKGSRSSIRGHWDSGQGRLRLLSD